MKREINHINNEHGTCSISRDDEIPSKYHKVLCSTLNITNGWKVFTVLKTIRFHENFKFDRAHKIIRRASCERPYFHGITDIPSSVSHIVPCFHWLFCDVEIPWRLWIVAGRVCKLISPYNLSSTKGSLAYSADWLPTTHLVLVLFAYYLSSLFCTVLFRKVRFRRRKFLFPILYEFAETPLIERNLLFDSSVCHVHSSVLRVLHAQVRIRKISEEHWSRQR